MYPFYDYAKACREYYFSSENLFKDVFLRKNMDSQGFVPIQILVQFHRLQVISSDVPTVLNALLSSTEVEVLYNSERGPVVRARHDPTKWVYPLTERDDSARYQGPSTFFHQAHYDTLRQMQDYHQQYQYQQPYSFDTQYGFPSTSLRPHEQDLSPPYISEADPHSPVSPHHDLQNQKLSGEASIFIPNEVNYGPPMMNGDGGAYDMSSIRNPIPPITEEPDEQVEVFDEDNLSNLVIVVNNPKDKPIIPALPMNGINHKTEEIHRSPAQPVTWRFSDNRKSGHSTAHDYQPPRNRTGERGLTEKTPKRQASRSGITESSYTDFRSRALQARQNSNRDSTHMINLYQFWSDFLCDHWVPGMYSEFMHFAVEDANSSRRTGLHKLFSMFERTLDAKFRTSIWNDFVRLAGEDHRNGHLAGIESVWRIRGNISAKGRNVVIQDGDVLRLIEREIQSPADFDRLRKEVKPASFVLVSYTTAFSLLDASNL
jgi:la-related protein 1